MCDVAKLISVHVVCNMFFNNNKKKYCAVLTQRVCLFETQRINSCKPSKSLRARRSSFQLALGSDW